MEELVQKAIQQAESLKKDPGSVPWNLDEPWEQSCYSWSTEDAAWAPVKLPTPDVDGSKRSSNLTRLALYSWNIDLMLPFPKSRMDAALTHLEELIEQLLSTATTAVAINLQECIPDDLITIGQRKWIRDRFYMTDIDDSTWTSGAYGTTMLVDRRLQIQSCFRIHFSKTRMERDALFVDIAAPGLFRSDEVIRLCNAHLESLVPIPPLRLPQMELIARYMHAEGVSGAIVAGDFNATQPSDQSLHSDNNLKDAHLELKGQGENTDEGYTWGQQVLPALRERFGFSRMDRMFFCGESIRLASFQRFGADVMIDPGKVEQREQLLALGFEQPWVTDHLGISAIFNFNSDHRS